MFCRVVSGSVPADIVYRDSDVIVFLDNSPLFPGHLLVCPTDHYETLIDLPLSLMNPVMRIARLLAGVVESALEADGSFVAINNRISQSVPHLHVHVVPRKRRDGLKGFFWPRRKYQNEEEREAVRSVLERELQKVLV